VTSDKNDAGRVGEARSSRWWEYYLVRYFVGSVVGSLLVLSMAAHLAEQFTGAVKDFIFSLISAARDGNIKSLFVLAATGVAFCYVASSPMMILHASRAQLIGEKSQNFNRTFYWLTATGLAVVLIGMALVMARPPHTNLLLAILIYSMIIGGQLALIIVAHIDKFASTKKFYLDLGKARTVEDHRSEYVESYRHLREHSNAYAILVLELLLAFVLVNTRTTAESAAVIVLWLLPAVYCWFIATLLEVVFTHSEKHQTEQS
jgi:hypothetical protein